MQNNSSDYDTNFRTYYSAQYGTDPQISTVKPAISDLRYTTDIRKQPTPYSLDTAQYYQSQDPSVTMMDHSSMRRPGNSTADHPFLHARANANSAQTQAYKMLTPAGATGPYPVVQNPILAPRLQPTNTKTVGGCASDSQLAEFLLILGIESVFGFFFLLVLLILFLIFIYKVAKHIVQK